MTIKVGAKVGEAGKIFGSVNNIQLAEAINKLGFNVDRKHVKITNDTIKEIGTYEAEVGFHRDVVETISFEVIGE
jgi:large subunit ribosomal protein L9